MFKIGDIVKLKDGSAYGGCCIFFQHKKNHDLPLKVIGTYTRDQDGEQVIYLEFPSQWAIDGHNHCDNLAKMFTLVKQLTIQECADIIYQRLTESVLKQR